MVASWLGHSHVVACLVFTPDGKGLLSGSWDKQVIHWDISSLGSLGMADPPVSRGVIEISRLIGHTVSLITLSFVSHFRHENQHSLEQHYDRFYFS